jgi:pimeloyl-ACP methyl ester carboxylesterase
MHWSLWLLLVAGVSFAAVYFFFPAWLVAATIAAIRKWGRMTAKSVVVDGITWPYLEGGPSDSTTIVMVHGFGGDKDNWSLYARYFTKQYHVIAPDLPGFGESVRRPDWHYGMEEQSERLNGFLDELGIDKLHLAGNSMGGFIALHYALVFPERLQSLTLIDNAGVSSRNKSEVELAIDERKNLLLATSLEEFDRLLDFIMYKRIPSPRFMVKAMFEVQARNFDFLDSIFWGLADEAVHGTVTDRLSEISVPTLVIWGRHDKVVDVSCTEAMAAAIPDNRVVIFEDAGHVPMIECPRDAANHHLELIADIPD